MFHNQRISKSLASPAIDISIFTFIHYVENPDEAEKNRLWWATLSTC